MSHYPGFDQSAGDLAVKLQAIALPEDVTNGIAKLIANHQGDPGKLAPVGFDIGDIDIFTLQGSIPLHIDEIDGSEESVSLGLILANTGDFHLTDGINRLPLPVGTVYRIKPFQQHGTCLADGSSSTSGHLAFITADYPDGFDVDTPENFLDWILQSVRDRL